MDAVKHAIKSQLPENINISEKEKNQSKRKIEPHMVCLT